MRLPFFSRRTDDPVPETPHTLPEAAIPVLWLLGKTGAGKSSLVRALTGLSGAEVGTGFVPCTRTSAMFDYPPEQPLLRFLDTATESMKSTCWYSLLSALPSLKSRTWPARCWSQTVTFG